MTLSKTIVKLVWRCKVSPWLNILCFEQSLATGNTFEAAGIKCFCEKVVTHILHPCPTFGPGLPLSIASQLTFLGLTSLYVDRKTPPRPEEKIRD